MINNFNKGAPFLEPPLEITPGCQPHATDKEEFPKTKFADKEGFPRVPTSSSTNHSSAFIMYCKFADRLTYLQIR